MKYETIFIPGGTFLMGSPDDEIYRSNNETQHEVKLSSFRISKYCITNEQYNKFIDETNYDFITYRSKNLHPVVNVSWNDAKAYCDWISNKTKYTCRLPTEAEWEYVCRAGTTTIFYTGDEITYDKACFNGREIEPVGSFPPNKWGLCDMIGNTWEWCEDWYYCDYYDKCHSVGVIENPKGPQETDSIDTGLQKVLRGGSSQDHKKFCRSAYRESQNLSSRHKLVGFRIVFVT